MDPFNKSWGETEFPYNVLDSGRRISSLFNLLIDVSLKFKS